MALILYSGQELAAGGPVSTPIMLHDFHHGSDGSHRRLQFMRNVGDKVPAHLFQAAHIRDVVKNNNSAG